MAKKDMIIVKGARENNLKNIDIEIPKNKLIVMTGLSGSGKTSLAFDTIYAEGQRRYVESLSAYARQFLGNMEKPDVDSIEGLSPAISIDQKTTSRNPRSTVGTMTEIYDYFRLLFARIGTPICPNHGIEIKSQTPEQMMERIVSEPEGSRIQILAPMVEGEKGTHAKLFEQLLKDGFSRVSVNGEMYAIEEAPVLEKNKKHTIEVVIDRIVLKPDVETRLVDSITTALKLTGGRMVALIGEERHPFSENFSCPHCDFSIAELEPRLFSFNSPFGACPECLGLGTTMELDENLVIPDREKSLSQGAVVPWTNAIEGSSYYGTMLKTICREYGMDFDAPVSTFTKKQLNVLFYGTGTKELEFNFDNKRGMSAQKKMPFEGVLTNLSRRYKETSSEWMREYISGFMKQKPCHVCHGLRLKKEALAVKINDKNIAECTDMTIGEAENFFGHLQLTERQMTIARLILKEINDRLSFLTNVGIGYLSLSRMAGTLSGGESQRIRLATQIGSRLTGVTYVLDEPSIGLHQRDNDRLIETLTGMRDLGNTVIVVEHDEDTMRAADVLVDIGPGSGKNGGEVIANGTPAQVAKNKKSITGAYLSGRKQVEIPETRRKGNGKKLRVVGAKENNLKNVTVDFPLGTFTAVTGVSGSGKSSLVNDILANGLSHKLYKSKVEVGKHKEIKGLEHIDKAVVIDQSPIGRTPRSNPVTYTGVFDDIRDLFANTNEAKLRGYTKGHFSFNVKGGRCEHCSGDGIIKIEMHFLPDVYVPCEVCHGQRYSKETLKVLYKDKNIADVLKMSIDEAVDFFANIPKIARKLQVLQDVGLGYIELGQAATTLSGGEAQRVKLASELQRRATGKAVYILDEPTTGLHVDDVNRLISVLQRIVDNGDTVIVIEHNLDMIKVADHIIDIGPEGGNGGGEVIATGTPEEVAKVEASFTGQYLAKILK